MESKKISVRELVEFLLRSGDIRGTGLGIKDPDAMQEGTRIHKKLQKRMGASYQAEVALSMSRELSYDDVTFSFTLEGRADGIFPDENGLTTIDEIKGVYRDLATLKNPVPVHRAQALCYAMIYATEQSLDSIGIRMTYCHIPTEEVRYFSETFSYKELSEWFDDLLYEYAKWAVFSIKWKEKRDASIEDLSFPFSYRKGQEELIKGVYSSIIRKKRLYLEAPTGVGKTIATIYPAVYALGNNSIDKIFYLTAKTITRTVAENTFALLAREGLQLKYVTLTAKEKICPLEEVHCEPAFCPMANGHFDRINEALYDILTKENHISRDCILSYAKKHNVCPFEFSLDISLWCDAIIGDYNYAFDPTACLKRYFAGDLKKDYLFLIDEAHNLVARAREMYSASLMKEDFLRIKKIMQTRSRKITRSLTACNTDLLTLKREWTSDTLYKPVDIDGFLIHLMRLTSQLEEYLQSDEFNKKSSSISSLKQTSDIPSEKNTSKKSALSLSENMDSTAKENLLNFYFNILSFQNIYELYDEHYIIYADFTEEGLFELHLRCMDPSVNLNTYLSKGKAAVFFSATFLPISYYKSQLAFREDDYAFYAPSPFTSKQRLLMVGTDVSTKYTRRTASEYDKFANYILKFVQAKQGNYLVFFPSYRMMEDIYESLENLFLQYQISKNEIEILKQSNTMSEEERETFLTSFDENTKHSVVGFCIMGGIFGEGIDLTGNRLIGTIIVGTGIPMVCRDNELYRNYFDRTKHTGFEYAYQYPGMNKVLQAAGRVIRTNQDYGAILLLDERFLQASYQALFPREWQPYEIVTLNSISEHLQKFWSRIRNDNLH